MITFLVEQDLFGLLYRRKHSQVSRKKGGKATGNRMALVIATICFIGIVSIFPAVGEKHHTVFVIVGGTGDLASKYLWNALFSVYTEQLDKFDHENGVAVNHTFDFLAAGRTTQDQGNIVLNNVLKKSVHCSESSPSFSLCEVRATEFINKVSYMSLREEVDYTLLCSEILDIFSRTSPDAKQELVLYLAIAPSAYETVSERFYSKCKKRVRKEGVSVKVGLEKPFGLDKASAEAISNKMLGFFRENEIYRVDHYLGKSVVKAILSFRALNPHIEKLLDKDHVERIEVFLKEKVGVEDRFSIYNPLGVLRDMHQSHLTQLMALMAMDLPYDLSDDQGVQDLKGKLLRQVASVKGKGSLFGQYSGYSNLQKDHEEKGSPSSAVNKSLSENQVPTFAATVLNVNSRRWQGVPFLLLSGKKLDTRESFVRVVFKSNRICVSHCEHPNLSAENNRLFSPITSQVVFHINSDSEKNIRDPAILVTKNLSPLNCPLHATNLYDSSLFLSTTAYGERVENFEACRFLGVGQPYMNLFKDLLQGRKTNFVSTRHLLLSWQIWDEIISAQKSVITYSEGDREGRLNFIIKENNLEFEFHEKEQFKSDDTKQEAKALDKGNMKVLVQEKGTASYLGHTPATFLGRKLVTSHIDRLALQLVRDIDQAAEADIASKGSFHLALAGGTSLLRVFQVLAQTFSSLLWSNVHIWQVDERCVAPQDQRSNFQALDRELLRLVDIPDANIHPMPVYEGGTVCDTEMGGARVYAEKIRHTVPNSQFDMIVLGVGSDGHVASLFPQSIDLRVDASTFVVITEDGPEDTQNRMTITLPLINRSKRIALFVTGTHKQEIISHLEDEGNVKGKGEVSFDSLPILGVNPHNGTVTWYMDFDAFMGSKEIDEVELY